MLDESGGLVEGVPLHGGKSVLQKGSFRWFPQEGLFQLKSSGGGHIDSKELILYLTGFGRILILIIQIP